MGKAEDNNPVFQPMRHASYLVEAENIVNKYKSKRDLFDGDGIYRFTDQGIFAVLEAVSEGVTDTFGWTPSNPKFQIVNTTFGFEKDVMPYHFSIHSLAHLAVYIQNANIAPDGSNFRSRGLSMNGQNQYTSERTIQTMTGVKKCFDQVSGLYGHIFSKPKNPKVRDKDNQIVFPSKTAPVLQSQVFQDQGLHSALVFGNRTGIFPNGYTKLAFGGHAEMLLILARLKGDGRKVQDKNWMKEFADKDARAIEDYSLQPEIKWELALIQQQMNLAYTQNLLAAMAGDTTVNPDRAALDAYSRSLTLLMRRSLNKEQAPGSSEDLKYLLSATDPNAFIEYCKG
jgi:hypothetical protein